MMSMGQLTGAWRGVFFASLFVNLLVLGVGLGMVLIPDDRRPPPVAMAGTGPFSHALSHDERRDFAARMREEMRGIAPARGSLRAQVEEIRALLRVDPLDRTALEAIFADQRQQGGAMQAQADRVLAEYLEGLDLSSREAIADRLGVGRGPVGRP